jgi:hypothetical protein
MVFDKLLWTKVSSDGVENLRGHGGPTNWPSNSPNLSPPNYFVWDYLKNCVYAQHLSDISKYSLDVRGIEHFLFCYICNKYYPESC